jgi:UDP-N-acetylmuramoylalanine--D-glutamate ligase
MTLPFLDPHTPEELSHQETLFELETAVASPRKRNAPISILGLSTSGHAAARLAIAVGTPSVLLHDSNPLAQLQDQALAGDAHVKVGSEAQLHQHATDVVVSPGIPPHSEVIQRLVAEGFHLYSEPDWAFLNQPPHVQRWISITGTNGKSTITSLITHLLQHLDPPRSAVACGNIGRAVSDVITKAWQNSEPLQPVVELSSYQLYYSQKAFSKIGVFSNLTPDHLAWHGDWSAYQNAKKRLLLGSIACHYAVINLDDPVGMQWAMQRSPENTLGIHGKAHALEALAIPQLFVNTQGVLELFLPASLQQALGPLLDFNQAYLSRARYRETGGHHTQNLLLAVGACLWQLWDTHTLPTLKDSSRWCDALHSFQGLAHRFQRLKVPAPFVVINDSKATNPEAGIAALQCIDQSTPAILLVGGLSKQTPLEDWAKVAQAHSCAVFCFGQDGQSFYQALSELDFPHPLHYTLRLEDALKDALTLQQRLPQHPLLFAPACASQDAFDDFEDRGRFFEATVLAFFEESSR